MKRKKGYIFLILLIILISIIGCSQESITSTPTTKNKPNENESVANPTMTPDGGNFSSEVTVTIKCATPQAEIRYTTNGTNPNKSSTLYSSPIIINSTTTIKAIAFKNNSQSQVITRTFFIENTVATPTFSINEGEYNTEFNVSISCLTQGALIYYTTDGSAPNINSNLYTTPVLIDKSIVLKAVAIKSGKYSSISSVSYNLRVKDPIFGLSSGIYTSSIDVTIDCPTNGVDIYYTTDDTTPDSGSIKYTSPINIPLNTNLTIKAVAIKSGWLSSSVISNDYTVTGTVATPTFYPGQGTYTSPEWVSINCLTSGATIRYTTNGSDPDETSTEYNAPIFVNNSMTIKAKAFKPNWANSETAIATYTITGTCATPLFSLDEGVYNEEKNVTITCISPPDATIYYTTDGTDPDTNSSVYSGPILIDRTLTLKAFAAKPEWISSSISSATYTLKPNEPSFDPSPGIYTSSQNIIISCDTTDAIIRYTLDGSTPDESSPIYSTPISLPLDSTTTIKAKAYKTNWTPSDISTGVYTITGKVATPSFMPGQGVYQSSIDVVISCDTTGATIRYTTDGSVPTEISPIYSGPINIPLFTTMTIKAKAYKTNWEDSEVATAIYTVNGPVAQPEFSPLPGLYTSSQNISISCATTGATIHYTTDGSTPNTGSPVYTSPINIPLDTTITLKAIAVKSEYSDSTIASGVYTITGTVATPIITPASGTYDTNQTITITTSTSGATIYYTTDGSTPTTSSNLYTGPFPLNGSWQVKAIAVKPNWVDSSIATNSYTLYRYYLYVPNNTANSISIFRINDNGTLTNVSTYTGLAGNGPRSIAVHPDGNYIYVTENSGGRVESFSVASNGNISSLGSQTITAAWGVAVNPNGNYLYVTSSSANNINVLSITNGVLGAPTSLGLGQNGPRDIEFADYHPSKYIYVPCFGGNRIVRVNVTDSGWTLAVGAIIDPAANGPSFVKVHKDINYIFASMTTGNRIRSYIYDSAGGVGVSPSNLALNQASLSDIYYGATHYLYITRPTNNAIQCASINQSTGALTLISFVNTNGTQPPYGVVVHPASWANYVYVTVKGTSNNVQLFSINTSTGALTWVANYATGTAPEKPAIVRKLQ